MRTTAILVVLLLVPILRGEGPAPLINPIGGAGQGDAGAASGEPLPADASVDQVLDALDQRGRSLREFTAKVSITTGDPDVDVVTTRTGNVWFQKKGDDDGRIHVVFTKKIVGKVTTDEKVEYLLDNGWLAERDYHKKVQTNRQVLKPGDKMNLLKLGEGPFPLPIGQKKEDVHKLFDITVVPAAKNAKDLADTIHLILTPKTGTSFKRRFGKIEVWVDRKTHFPVQIRTVNPDDGDPHKTKLEDVQVNPGIKNEEFTLPGIDQGAWGIHTEPYQD